MRHLAIGAELNLRRNLVLPSRLFLSITYFFGESSTSDCPLGRIFVYAKPVFSDGLDCVLKLFEIHRLLNVTVDPQFVCAVYIVVNGRGGKYDNRDGFCVFGIPNLSEYFQSGDMGEFEVQQNQLW